MGGSSDLAWPQLRACFPAHVGARRRPRGGADSRWTAVGDLAVGRRRPRGGAEDCRARLFVGDGSFLANRGDKTAGLAQILHH
jgi:hypothetical protein